MRAADFYGTAAAGSALDRLAGGMVIRGGRAQEGEPPLVPQTPSERSAMVGPVAFAESTIGLLALLLIVMYFGGRLVNR